MLLTFTGDSLAHVGKKVVNIIGVSLVHMEENVLTFTGDSLIL